MYYYVNDCNDERENEGGLWSAVRLKSLLLRVYVYMCVCVCVRVCLCLQCRCAWRREWDKCQNPRMTMIILSLDDLQNLRLKSKCFIHCNIMFVIFFFHFSIGFILNFRWDRLQIKKMYKKTTVQLRKKSKKSGYMYCKIATYYNKTTLNWHT